MNQQFRQKYLFTGQLVLKTGLHIGGGQTLFSASDSPVIRTPEGTPFIPGSSFKGAFRSTVEKLAPLAGLWSCGLVEGPVRVGTEDKTCVGPQGQAQRDLNDRRSNEGLSEAELLAELETGLCDTCKLFGSPYIASKISFSDLYLSEGMEGIIQIRDGVAIDRDSERAVDNLLYNYEVVAPTLAFNLEIWLDDPNTTDLGLTCLGLSEFLSGFGYLGGKRSRGLGQCELKNLTIYHLDLSGADGAKNLLKYLTGRTPEQKMQVKADPNEFVNDQIKKLLEGQAHA